MAETDYLLYYNDQAGKRHYHKTEKGEVTRFMVQLEVKIENRWMPVIRYDCAHDFFHKDRYNKSGDQLKEELHLPYKEALTFADEDIDEHWEVYMLEFMKRIYP